MEPINTEYGILCELLDEKKLVKNINAFLEKECGYRKMYKTDNVHMLNARLPFVYSHFYNQFLKQSPGWYFELYPNADLEGKLKFPAHSDAGWVLYVSKSFPSEEKKEEVTAFFEKFLGALGFEFKLLYQYKDKEERL